MNQNRNTKEGSLDGAYITRRWGIPLIKCTRCDWSERATSQSGYADVLMCGHNSDHAAADTALKAKVRSKLDFHDDLAWLMIAEGQKIEQDQIPDEVHRLASMATDPVLLASFLTCIVVALLENTPASIERAVTASSMGRMAADAAPEQRAVLEFQADLAWQMILEANSGDEPENHAKLERLASTATAPELLAGNLAYIAAFMADDTAANLKRKARLERAE